MVVQEDLPGLRPPPPALRNVFGDRRLSDFDAELQQFARDAWCTPKPVRHAHVSDQAADLQRNPRPTAPRARLQAPVHREAGPVPPDDRLWLDNVYGSQHRRKQAIQPHEEQSVGHRELRLWGQPSTQDIHLMPQQDDLGFQPRSRLERRDHDVEEQVQERDHKGSGYLIPPLTPAWMEFSVRTVISTLALVALAVSAVTGCTRSGVGTGTSNTGAV